MMNIIMMNVIPLSYILMNVILMNLQNSIWLNVVAPFEYSLLFLQKCEGKNLIKRRV
jgi:hypothetical protein